MKAANDVLLTANLSGQAGSYLEDSVHKGDTSYNVDEFFIGKETTDEMVAKDTKEGRVNKYVLKAMADPRSLPVMEQARFENMKRSEEAMKQLRKQYMR